MHPPVRALSDATTCDGMGARFEALLRRQEDLSDALEGLADDLPARVDTHGALRLSRGLRPILRRCHLEEETVIFPALRAVRDDLGPILHRLRVEHMEDEDHAGDLHDAMGVFVSSRTGRDADRIGYMLRTLFVGLRRHVAFDRDHVLPIVRGIDRS